MKILSWNILADEFIKKRYYPMIPPEILLNRKQRQIQILLTLKQLDMDVLLLQEVMQGEYNRLVQTFQKTHHLLRGKNIKWQGKQGYSGNVILLRKSLFSLPVEILFEYGIGVKCTYKNRPLHIFNIHLDDISHPTRMKQIEELITHTTNHLIIGGDFNENYQSENPTELYKQIKKAGLKILNQKSTYYIERKMSIDNILVKGVNLKHTTAYVLEDFQGDIVKQFITYGSDHLPVVVN
jgi:endonuclease/exonuclease/phosphatase family metal-dependent hydrolase